MTWQIPNWWTTVLLALAAFRLWRLLAEDTILDRPRAWVTNGQGWADDFVRCPWCLGSWIAAGWWLAWCAWPHGSLVAAGALAITVIVGLIAANLDPD